MFPENVLDVEEWEKIKPANFVVSKSEPASGRSSQIDSRLSPERSKSEMKQGSPRLHLLQRSNSSPVSDSSGRARLLRPLQSQLNMMEGIPQVIREQTEVSHITEKERERTDLSKEKMEQEAVDVKPELGLQSDVVEEEEAESGEVEEVGEVGEVSREESEEKVEAEVQEMEEEEVAKDPSSSQLQNDSTLNMTSESENVLEESAKDSTLVLSEHSIRIASKAPSEVVSSKASRAPSVVADEEKMSGIGRLL